MASLKIEIQGGGIIDSASIYLEDPSESIEYKLQPASGTDWKKEVNLPIMESLEYSLHIVAFSGTNFTCTITDVGTNKKVQFAGVTGIKVKNRANIKGSQNFI